MKKIITVTKNRNEIFKQQQLTIGVDLGDRISNYCILDETGNVILESGEIAKGLGLELHGIRPVLRANRAWQPTITGDRRAVAIPS